MSFSFACEPQSLSSPLSHTAQAQDTARLVLIKGIKWYSDSQGEGPAHEKRRWLFGFCGVDVWLVEHDSGALYKSNHTAAFMSIKHVQTKAPHQRYPPLAHVHFWAFLKMGKKKNYNVKICLLSARCHSFLNVKLCLSFYLALSPTVKCPELVFHIFRSSALMKELHSERRKGNRDRAESQSL